MLSGTKARRGPTVWFPSAGEQLVRVQDQLGTDLIVHSPPPGLWVYERKRGRRTPPEQPSLCMFRSFGCKEI